MKRSSRTIDTLVIGFALFSMFFGAGNVIFPPYLGLQSGSHWLLGFICYFLADIGLALVAIFATLRTGEANGITRPIGKVAATILLSAIILCIGPMLAIPRTAASTFEMSITPLFPGFSSLLFSILFFTIILLLSIRESAVVDIVGKILTPALLIGLLILIVKGALQPLGPIPDAALVENIPTTGIKAGYQTMDVLAAIIFGIIILKSAEEKGYTNFRDKSRIVAVASLVAGAVLLIVYLGLTYLGATASNFFDLSVDRTVLVMFIVKSLLHNGGTVLFAIVVALACITTAVALVSCSASFFSDLSRGRISYQVLVVVICVFSAAASNIGLEQIISIAAPILDIVYPPSLALIILAFFHKYIQNDWIYRCAALGAVLTSLLTVASAYLPFLAGIKPLLDCLPLSFLGLGWILPSAICGVLGAFIPHKEEHPTPAA